MQEKLSFSAKKTIKINKSYALVEILVLENDQLATKIERKLLEGYIEGSLSLDEGEKKTLKNMLIRKGFIDTNDKLTELGESLIKNRKLFRWHRGVAMLLYVIDWPFESKVLHFEWSKINSNYPKIEEFSNYSLISDKWYKSIITGNEFKLRFPNFKNNVPKIQPLENVDLEVIISFENNTSKRKLVYNDNEGRHELIEEIAFPLDQNLKNLFPQMRKSNITAIPMEFEEVIKDEEILNKFKTKKAFSDSILVNSKVDNGWEIEVTVPVIPAQEKDAGLWIEELLRRELRKKEGYISQDGLINIFNEIVEASTIPEALPNWHFSLQSFTSKLQKDEKELFYKIKTADDIWVDFITATSSPDELNKKVIVVDGSNVAWNMGDRKRGDKPFAKNIELLYEYLLKRGYERIIIYCDASLRHQVSDIDKYNELLQAKRIVSCPSRTIADYFILETANKYGCYIVSNDKYRDWIEYPKYNFKNIVVKKFLIHDENAIVYDLEEVN